MNNLRLLRNERGLTLLAVGLELDISQSTIQQYESGVSEPNIAMLIRLANFYGVTVDYLIGRTPIRDRLNSDDEKLAYKLNHMNNPEAVTAALALLEQVK